jgi:hypothetical protein
MEVGADEFQPQGGGVLFSILFLFWDKLMGNFWSHLFKNFKKMSNNLVAMQCFTYQTNTVKIVTIFMFF